MCLSFLVSLRLADQIEGVGHNDENTEWSLWAPAGRGKGALASWKCCKVFCVLAVTVNTCSGVLTATTKKVVNFFSGESVRKKILRAPIVVFEREFRRKFCVTIEFELFGTF